MSEHARLPHAILDRDSRIQKADKIAMLLKDVDLARCRRILEIGCGSGIIAARLAELAPQAIVQAVDVADNRIVFSGFEFAIVKGTDLPFRSEQFDLVISNHVIEHVGSHLDQLEHLREIARVLSPSGVGYLAVPNKWRLIEPHYHLPLLSWLPQKIADYWVQKSGRGAYYDCAPLSCGSALQLFEEGGLAATDITLPALRATLEVEHPQAIATRVARLLPDVFLGFSKPIIPTLIYLLKKQKE